MLVRKLYFPAKLSLLMGALLIFGGCGSDGRHDLSGHVTLADGSPMAHCRVIFRSATVEGSSYWGMTDEEGYYEASTTIDGTGIEAAAYSVSIMEDLGDSDHPNPAKAHGKYSNPKMSGLQVTVPAENDTCDFVLDPPQQRRR